MKEIGFLHQRPGKATPRMAGKGIVGFFATQEEKTSIQGAADDRGITVAELLRRIANGKIHLTDTAGGGDGMITRSDTT